MNWLKRAILNLTRRYVRSLILIVIFSVIAALLFSGISIMDASGRLEAQAKSTVGSEVTISWNMAKVPTKNGQFDPVLMTEKQLASLAGQPHVKDYNLVNNSIIGVADGFSVTGDRSVTLLKQKLERKHLSEQKREDLAKNYLEPDISIYGVRKSELSDQFVSGGYKLISGRPLTENDFGENVALITKQLADENKLKLGDTIHINTSDKQTHYHFKIVGIFTTPAPASKYLAENSAETPYNSIFIPYTQVGLFYIYKPYTLDDSVMTANFYLDDPAYMAGFTSYAKKLLQDNYIIQSNDNLYEAAVMPLESVSFASKVLAAITLVAGGIIFALIVVFSLRGRRHEFGVLLAVGEKRKKILSQIFVEVLVPVIISFGVGVACGGKICGIIGNRMISQNAAAVQEQQNQKLISEKYTGNQEYITSYVGKAVSASPISKIDMSVSARDLGLLAAACLILTVVSSAAPCISMMRYKPRQILQQK